MMKMKKMMKKIAVLMAVCGFAGAAQAADLLVGGYVESPSGRSDMMDCSYFDNNTDLVFWIGKCNLNLEDDPREKYTNAEPIEVEYEIFQTSAGKLGDSCGQGFSSNGLVRVKSGTFAKITGFGSGDCVYIAEVLSTNFPDIVTDFGQALDYMFFNSDNLEGGDDGNEGQYWYVTNIADVVSTGEVHVNVGYVTCGVLYHISDPNWQCRIGNDKYKTLGEAIGAANAGDTIYLRRDVDLAADLTIDKNVTITTENGGLVAIRRLGDCSIDIAADVTFTNVVVNGLSYAATKPMFDVANGATLTLAADTRVNSCVNTSGDGGAIRSSGTVVLDGARIVTSSAAGRGGAIYAAGGTVDARGGEITGCSAEQGGGAIYLADGAKLKLSGAFHATGNTAGDAANNVEPTGSAQIVVPGAFTGSVGVTYPAAGVTARDGVQFGLVQGGANVANRFQSDVSPSTCSAAVESDGRLVWRETNWDKPIPVVMSPVDLESIVVTGAVTKTVGDDVVLIFTNTAAVGTFNIPSNTFARLLCVAGGAAGGTVGLGVTNGAAGGGGAGGFYEIEKTVLKPGTYEISVGAGAPRVDSYTESWVGNIGGLSWIRQAGESVYLMSAKGGGGGGAPKPNGVATEGGSGGGGSWYDSKALAAGSATDGYGWKGAKPTEESVGGGGGGAAVASTNGLGKATGEGGEGRASDITGETVIYSAGGNGGRRLDATFVPQDGATPGSGGDGAGVTGKGGAGADGIVVVRLEKAFTPVKVPYPSFSTGVAWVDGSTVCPFDDLVAATNRFFIADIEGTLEVPCSKHGQEFEGTGRYSFTITLKDGYAWDDGSPTGDTTPRKFFWRVKEPDIEGHATAELTKTVEWSDGTNATLSISAHTTPEKTHKVPKVLVLGTLCDAHRLTAETLETCLNTAAEVANVDYYLYAEVTEEAQNVFEMEDVAIEFWEEFWEEFWATRDQWEEEGESWWIEHWDQISDYEESLEESLPQDVYLDWGYGDWDEYWDGYWDMFWYGWEDDGYWPMYEAYCEAYGDDEGWEEYWENYWIEEYWIGFWFAQDWGWGYDDYRELEDIEPLVQGKLSKGETFADQIKLRSSMNHPQHHALYGFYERLAKVIDDGEKYDYIILCFDRSHVGDEFPGAHSREADVAEYLKQFYAEGRVIWMVDNETPGLIDRDPIVWATPWRPSQFKCITPDSGAPYWTTYYANLFKAGGDFYDEDLVAENRQEAWTVHKALFGMFDPEAYETLDKQTFYTNIIDCMSTFTPAQVEATSGNANPNQVVYDDAGSVSDMVRQVIKPNSYTVTLEDEIKVDQDLALDGVSGRWTANQDQGWTELVEGETLFPTEKGATVKIKGSDGAKGVDTDIWIELKLEIHDKGWFRSSIDAQYNPTTGEWEKDPNKGPAEVRSNDANTYSVLTREEQPTIGGWTFYGYNLTGEVMSGTNTGAMVVNGYTTNKVAVAANSSPQVVFRAAPGYILERVVVDGEDVDFNIMTCEEHFDLVNAHHDVKVWYKPYQVVDPPPPETGPVTNLYDGTAYGPTVTNVHFSEEIPYPWYPVYSMDPDAPNDQWSTTNGQTTVVWGEDGTPQPTNVYVRIAVEQPGWEEPVVLDNWTGVNTVTILPREITIQYENYVQTNDVQKTTDFDWHLVESQNVTNQLVEGDYVTESGSCCTNPPAKGGHTIDSITNDPDNVVVHNPDGTVSGNYIVHVLPGDYYYPEKEIIAESKGVEKIYDGKPSTIEVTAAVDRLPTVEELHERFGSTGDYAYIGDVTTTGIVIKYSGDGGQTFTLDEPPEFTDVGTNTVPYQVTYEYTFKHGTDEANVKDHPVTYDTITGSADVIITPRPVYVTADSAFKYYDGTELTTNGYTVAAATDVTGFVEGEGATFAMTDGSTVTNPDTKPNVIDPGKTQPTGETKLSNYEFCYIDGTLEVKDRVVTVPTGYEDIYDGGSHGIGVTVSTTSEPGTILNPGTYDIVYSLTPDDPESWTNDLSFVNVGVSNKVYYIVTVSGYDPITNFEYVTIWPREVVVTADDKQKRFGEADPELTWKVTSGTRDGLTEEQVGILPGEEDIVNNAVSNDVRHAIVREGAGTEAGEQITSETNPPYPITPSGSEYLGNYHITYIPGKLIVDGTPYVVALWITDHADAGDGYVHLQFEPSFNVRPKDFAAWAVEANANGRFWVFRTDKPGDIEKVTTADTDRAVQATIRAIKEPIDTVMGRIWITFRLPQGRDGKVNYEALSTSKIVILDAEWGTGKTQR